MTPRRPVRDADRRAQLSDGETSMTAANDLAVRRTLEVAGVEFIDENGGGPDLTIRNLRYCNGIEDFDV
jgi:hypothetical protein